MRRRSLTLIEEAMASRDRSGASRAQEPWTGESRVVAASVGVPMTVPRLVAGFRKAGLSEGMTVLVHSSLSALGWVAGGPQAVIQALQQLVTADGTLVMPTHSTSLTDPEHWRMPSVPESWWEEIRQEMPAFDVDATPTRSMGVIPELFRKLPDVRRSLHPQASFAAWGKHRDSIIGQHSLAWGLGEESPLARLYDLNASVFLLGVGHRNNTSMHLAEYRAVWPGKSTTRTSAPMLINGERQWLTFDDLAIDSCDFDELGRIFDRVSGVVRHAVVGRANCRLMPQRDLVDFAVRWMEENRPWLHTDNGI
jgi:aminoglycoside 3-N-acetyltransferase